MKKLITITVIVAGILCCSYYLKKKFYDTKHRAGVAEEEVTGFIKNKLINEGDMIFQTSLSRQSMAVQAATGSVYSHCGLIFKKGNEYYVFEAVQPVKFTPLGKWIARGKDGHFVIKRLKNASQLLTPHVLIKMKEEGEKLMGKNYDLTFEWSDSKMYCSELIWKIYKRGAHIEPGKLERLSNFNLSNMAVKQKLEERYGTKIPLNETVISPVSILNSPLLYTVVSN